MSDGLRLNELTAGELTALLSQGKCTVSEIAAHCRQQIERVDGSIHAWVHVNAMLIESNVEALENKLRTGRSAGALFGIPIGVKDVFNTRDMPTQMGSPIWHGFHPGNDARVVHYLRMADALVFGKTVTAEFAVHAPGPTCNPHNLAHSPGTSSSGSAAAVSCRMVPIALGTQTAGSILRPASYCGVYGFKPSFGLIPRTGTLKTTDTLDTIGGFARSVEDISMLFDTIRVRGRDFPISEKALNDPHRREKPAHRPWRIGLVKGPKWHDAEPYARTALESYAQRLAKHPVIQAEVEEVELPAGFDRVHDTHSTIYDKTLAYYFQREFEKRSLVSTTMNEIVARGLKLTLQDYELALEKQRELAAALDASFEKYDFLLGLTTGGEALKGLDSVDRPDNCLIWTFCGVPALNLPVFAGPLGLPFGAQLVSRRYNDYLLLNFAAELARHGLAGVVTYPPAAMLEQAGTSAEFFVQQGSTPTYQL